MEINGDWDAFINWAHADMRATDQTERLQAQISTERPAQLPELQI